MRPDDSLPHTSPFPAPEAEQAPTPSAPQSITVPESEPSGPRKPTASDADVPLHELPTEDATPSQVRRAQMRIGRVPQVHGYRIVEPLGAGTYGEVWLAEEQTTGIKVAIKFFTHGSPGRCQFLLEEVSKLAQLDAVSGIVQLKDVEPDATPPYYIMAYAEGGALAERLEQGPIPLPEALAIFRAVAEALAYVHAKGFRHCDLKPGNVLLDARGRPLIADFGQAHLSCDDSPALGTFFYMAPEQADLTRQIPDTGWDVYGLGALFYAMLTGGTPPRMDEQLRTELNNTANLGHRLRRYREWIPQAPPPRAHHAVRGMDRSLAHIIDRCLEVDPAKRLPDAGAVLAALKHRRQWLEQKPMLLFGLIAPIVVLIALATIGLWATRSTARNAERTLANQVLQQNRYSAQLVANVVQDQLAERKDLLENLARRPELVRAVLQRDRAVLDKLLHEVAGPSDCLSFIVVDGKGDELAFAINGEKLGPDREAGATNFCFRDWFHGQGDYAPGWSKLAPIARTHVSHPYLGKKTGHRVIAIATPVRAEDGQLTGVLQATVSLAQMNQWLTTVPLEHGRVLLLDSQGHGVIYTRGEGQTEPGNGPQAELRRRLQEAAVERRPPEPLVAAPSLLALAGSATAGTLPDHADPLDGVVCLTGYAPVPKVNPNGTQGNWLVLVEHEQAALHQPVAELQRQLLVMGGTMLAVVCLMSTGLWAWLYWTLRQAE